MKFILFIILFVGVTAGLYWGGLQYEEQSEECVAFRQFAEPKLEEVDQLNHEIEQIKANASQQVEAVEEGADQAIRDLKGAKKLSDFEKFALKVIDADGNEQNELINKKEEALQAELNKAQERFLQVQKEKKEKIDSNNIRLDQTKVGKRDELGRKYSGKSTTAHATASQQLDKELAVLEEKVNHANEALQKEIDEAAAQFDKVKRKVESKKEKLAKLREQIDELADDPNKKLSLPVVQRVLSKSGTFSATNKEAEETTEDTDALIKDKTERCQKLMDEVTQHPYAEARKEYIIGLPLYLLGLLIIADAFIMSIFFSILRRR